MTNNLKYRIENYYKINTQLAYIDKNKLDSLLDDENKVQSWGTNQIIKLGKRKVFVKRVPLTELEYKNMFSTKNLYNLPTFYNYGVGSAGFGAFRELVTHIKTTNWVLEGAIENFPLMYHYRIVPCSDKKTEIDMEKHKEYIEYWNNDKNISKYIIDRKNSKYEIVIFLEYFPYTLSSWLGKNSDKLNKVVSEIRKTILFLQKREIIHFDIHLGNIITDGETMYLTDFGLTLDRKFDLNKKEQEFFKQNSHYDYGLFLFGIGLNFFSIYKKNHLQLKKYGINDEMPSYKRFIIFLKNIEEIYADDILKLDEKYVCIIKKYCEIIILMGEFFGEMIQNNKEDKKYNYTKLVNLLKKTKFLPPKENL